MATELGTAYVQIVPSAQGFESSLSTAIGGQAESAGKSAGQKAGTGIATGLKVTGAALVGIGTAAAGAGKAIWDAANSTAAVGDTIDKQSQKMGVSAEEYQVLSFAAEHSGISISKFQTAAAKVEASGFEGSVYDYVASLQSIEDPAERAAAANAVLGEKLANELQPLVDGSTTIEDYGEQLSSLGGIMSNEAVAGSAGFEDAMTDMQTAMSGFTNNLMAQVLPGMTTFMSGIAGLVSGQEGASEQLTTGAQQIVDSLTAMIPQLLTFVTSIATALLEAAPTIITSLATGIVTAIPTLVPTIVEAVTSIATTLVTLLPQFLQAGIDIIVAIIEGLGQAIPKLIPAFIEAILGLVQTLIDNIPTIIEAAISFFSAIVDALPDAIIQIVEALPDLIVAVCNALIVAIPEIITAFFTLMSAMVDALPDIITALCDALPDIITAIVTLLTDPNQLAAILQGAITLFTAIITAIPQIIVALAKALPKIIVAIGNGLKPGLQTIAGWGKDMTAKAKEAIGKVIEGIKAKFETFKTIITNIGKNIVTGLWNGISNAKDWIVEKISGFVSGVTDAIKDFFGIHSPSRLMRDEVGIYVAYGIGEGFEEGMDDVNKDIDASLQHTYAVAPAYTNSYDYNNESIGSQMDMSLNSALSRLQATASPVVELVIKSDSETLYKQVMKGELAYNGRYNMAVSI